MKYNMTGVIMNGGGGTRELVPEELESLVDGDTSSGIITLSSGNIINIVCDLGNRYSLHSIKYYYSGSGSITIAVSDSSNVWYNLETSTFSGGIQADTGVVLPNKVSITHSVLSGTSSVYEVEIHTNDSNILFGNYGTTESYGMDTSGEKVDVVRVYNNSNEGRDFYVFIDDTGSEADDVIRIGLTSSGSFCGIRQYGLFFPNDFSWDNGLHVGTWTDLSGYLSLSGSVTSGTYYSPVFNSSGHNNFRFFWDGYEPAGARIDYFGTEDGDRCLGVRSYQNPPTGAWVNGQLPEQEDPLWSTPSGSLSFYPAVNNSILRLPNNSYIQFVVTITGSISNKPQIIMAGIETPLVVPSVPAMGASEFYITAVSGTSSGKSTNLICWYREI